MPCYKPQRAYRAPGGQVTFVRNEGWSDRSFLLPCGRCLGCQIERKKSWAVRCVHEAQCHDENSYITLTYSDENMPENWSLDVRDWQKFAKRLRKKCGPFRFFHCGEYDEGDRRPHYHAILFGLDFPDRYYFKQSRAGKPVYRSPLLESIWTKGYSSVGDVTFESAAYVAGYCLKKKTGPMAEKEYERVNVGTGEVVQVSPEYCTMSRRPGLGKVWFKKFKDDVFPHDEVIHQNRHLRPPRYYDSLLPDHELDQVKARRRTKAMARAAELTQARLDTKEICLDSRLKGLKRSIK